jgi:hypothetical protein
MKRVGTVWSLLPIRFNPPAPGRHPEQKMSRTDALRLRFAA